MVAMLLTFWSVVSLKVYEGAKMCKCPTKTYQALHSVLRGLSAATSATGNPCVLLACAFSSKPQVRNSSDCKSRAH